LTVHD